MTARDRVNRGRIVPPMTSQQAGPLTNYERAMARHAASELVGWLVVRRLATVAQWVCGLAGLAGMPWHGLNSLVLGVVGVWLFGQAKPSPTQSLDDYTKRKAR